MNGKNFKGAPQMNVVCDIEKVFKSTQQYGIFAKPKTTYITNCMIFGATILIDVCFYIEEN